MEKLPEENIKDMCFETVWASVSYMMMKRCGINPQNKLGLRDFSFIKNFNNDKIITALGTAISDIAEMGINEIAKVVINLQKEEKNINHTFVENKKQEYSNNRKIDKGGNENDKYRIQESRRISDTKFSDGERENTKWKIRKSEAKISKGKQEGSLFDIIDGQRIKQRIDENTRSVNKYDKSNSGETNKRRWDNREIERTESYGMDRQNEQLQIDSRGTSNEGDSLQLSLFTKQNEELVKCLKTEKDQINYITENTGNFLKANIKKKHRNKIEYFDLHPEISINERHNFIIADDNLGVGTPKEKYQRNIEAIRILKKCEEQNRYATPEEQKLLSQYVGWGGLADVFDSRKDNWHNEYEELKSLLTEKEYREAKQSTLTAFYTPPVVIKSIYKALEKMGLERGNILEPSCRSG